MQKLMHNIPAENLKVYIVWLPALRSDNKSAAARRSSEYQDKRLSYFWDGNRITGKTWQRVLGIERMAWDVYFLYGAAARWKNEPTPPDFWMHQLGGVSKGAHLQENEFESEARRLIAKSKNE